MLRNAFKALGFDGMVEVALFADILTLKEALEWKRGNPFIWEKLLLISIWDGVIC